MSLANDVESLVYALNGLKLTPADDTNMRDRLGTLFVAAVELSERFIEQPQVPQVARAVQSEPTGVFKEAMATDLSGCPKCGQPADGPRESQAHPDWPPFYVCRKCKDPQRPDKDLLWSSAKKWEYINSFSK
jgi:hypothetical protein